MVGDDDAVNAVLGALDGVFDGANAFYDEWQACEISQPVEPVPCEADVIGRRPIRKVWNAHVSAFDEIRPVAQTAPVQAGLRQVQVANIALLGAADGRVNG